MKRAIIIVLALYVACILTACDDVGARDYEFKIESLRNEISELESEIEDLKSGIEKITEIENDCIKQYGISPEEAANVLLLLFKGSPEDVEGLESEDFVNAVLSLKKHWQDSIDIAYKYW